MAATVDALLAPTGEQRAVAQAIRNELSASILWRSPFPPVGLLYESDTTPCAALVVTPDGGISTPLSLAPHARAWRAEHPDSDHVYGYLPRTERIVRNALRHAERAA